MHSNDQINGQTKEKWVQEMGENLAKVWEYTSIVKWTHVYIEKWNGQSEECEMGPSSSPRCNCLIKWVQWIE